MGKVEFMKLPFGKKNTVLHRSQDHKKLGAEELPKRREGASISTILAFLIRKHF
jgi:hypothetical protein